MPPVSAPQTSKGNPFGPLPGPDALSGVDTGEGAAGVRGINVDPGGIGVKGFGGDGATGFLGGNDPQFHQHAGVYGESDQQGVFGRATTDTGTGVFGNSPGGGFGVRGESAAGVAVQGHSFTNGIGVRGESVNGNGVVGTSQNTDAVVGLATAKGKAGVLGLAPNGNAVVGISDLGTGLFAKGGQFAAAFEGKVFVRGDVEVTGDLRLLNADLAEDFPIAEPALAEPGTLMALDAEGTLQPSRQAYDRRVVGVISGAGDFKPGIVLDQQATLANRLPIALVGKVFCKADAQFGSIAVGDLLTTSPTPGHAMKADDPVRALGAMIGKALRPLAAGQGMIPILVALN